MNVPCPVHADRRAHRGCRHCRKAICRLCEVKMRGHVFCSTRCARDSGRAEIRKRVQTELSRPVPGRVAVAVVLAAVCAPTVFALRAVAELDRLHHPALSPLSPRPTLVRIERIVPGPDGASIEGRAPAGGAVFLFAGSRFIATAYAEDGLFRFERVQADGPFRVGSLPLASASVSPSAPEPERATPPERAAGPVAAASAVPGTGSSIPPPESVHPSPSRAAAVPAPRPLGPPLASVAAARAPSERLPAVPDLFRGPRDRRDVLVSFDAGSSDRGAREILDALRERRIRTTIFLTGEFIRRYPEVARRVASDGHEVGNHTDTHPHLTTYAANGRQATRPGVDRAFLDAELARTARIYDQTTGRTMAPVWRAPFGEQNEEIRRWAARAGYWHVGWTGGRAGLDGLDWVTDPRSKAYRTSERLVESLVQRAENGGIVLLHLGSDRADPVASKIPQLFDGLSARGFRFARASEFLEREGLTDERLAALAGGGAGTGSR